MIARHIETTASGEHTDEGVLVFATCVGPDDQRYLRWSRPSIDRAAAGHDIILTASGEHGICRAYNDVLERCRHVDRLAGVVLLHDDVEIVDPRFRAKLMAAFAGPNAGVVGVAGGAGLRGLAWWHARRRHGLVYETRGLIELGSRYADVDALDGCLLALSPVAATSLRFDAERFPRFHGYDVDICLQAREYGLRVQVLPLDVVHRTKGGYGDRAAFHAAEAELAKKWPQSVRRGPVPPALAKSWIAGRNWAQGRARRRAVDLVHRLLPTARPDAEISASASTMPCSACRHAVELPAGRGYVVVPCPSCGLGITWPAPTRDVETDGLFTERYGGLRKLRARTWDREAELRVGWVELFLADGCILEVGSATGEFVNAARRAGFDSYGVEVSGWAAEHARRSGADVLNGYLSDWVVSRPGLQPDAVAMWHVLEHVPDPTQLLREIGALVGVGGRLFLEVPNWDAVDAQRLGVEWEATQPKDHFHHFGPRSLTTLLTATGFDVVEMRPMTRRVYTSTRRWKDRHTEALLGGGPWPSLDLLRAAAVVTSTSV